MALVLGSDKGAKGNDRETFASGIRNESLDKCLSDAGSPQGIVDCGVVSNNLSR
jgi:hypothetical protein